MADFCHEYDPGGIGCPHPDPCPDGCLGDFDENAHEAMIMLSAGYEIQLGLCEGHGGMVYAVMEDDGSTWCEHRGSSEGEPTTRVKVEKR